MPVWYEEGIRFACQGCGGCCVDRGEYAFVFLLAGEEAKLARALDLTVPAFLEAYTRDVDGYVSLVNREERCVFLKPEGGCAVYGARPLQCRTWPFWRENLRPRVWQREVVPQCPGIGKGRRYGALEIDRLASEHRFARMLTTDDPDGGPGASPGDAGDAVPPKSRARARPS